MTPERWHQITDVFQAALGRDTARRSAFLDEACAGDPDLRSEVEAMLGSHARAGAFGETPIAMSTMSMPRLESGALVGPYRIERVIGAGGMGVVYRAHDPRVGRDVAVKMLPAEYATDAERLRRFEQEARAVGALNHPNLLTLYDVGTSETQPYLVTELVEGETLRDQILRGPVPSRRACEVVAEIAHGLAAAHAKGIVHRDLKPENIMITRDGRVKILDFGVAKLRPARSADGVTRAPAGTQPQTVLGTAGYMAPEQVEGLAADERADLFALGAILFELVTARRAFDGESPATVGAAVLNAEPPPLSSIQPHAPPALERAVRKCLAKDPDRRWQTARDLADELTWIGDDTPGVRLTESRRGGHVFLMVASGLLVLATIVLAVSLWVARRPAVEPPLPVVRAVIALGEGESLAGFAMALSPDGTHLVYGARGGLHLRPVNQSTATLLPGTAGGYHPFFSPDGKWIAFFSRGLLRKASIAGGSAVTICECVSLDSRGGSWGPDDTIVFSPRPQAGLWRVPAAGGVPQVLTSPDSSRGEKGHRFPEILPDGSAVLFTIAGRDISSFDDARIEAMSLSTGERKVLVQGGMYGRYMPTRHLMYARDGALFAVSFDARTLEVMGSPVRVLDRVQTGPIFGDAAFALSTNGVLVYAEGGSQGGRDTVVWLDRQGVERPLIDKPAGYLLPSVSPEGNRLAVTVAGANNQEWLYDLTSGTFTRLTLDEDFIQAIWTPDGRRLTYSTTRSHGLFSAAVDGGEAPELLLSREHDTWPSSWSPDGQALAFTEANPNTRDDIWILPLAGNRKPYPFVQTPFRELQARFSPDGRWIAYSGRETDRFEVYVRPYPGPGGKIPVSTNSGARPIWNPNGRELFYFEIGTGRTMVVPVETSPTFRAGRPRVQFQERYWDVEVAPDGQHFVGIKEAPPHPPVTRLQLISNWFVELRRHLAPPGS